ncbi:MAG: peptidoglycan DD-metalloendopeptidase family protein [Candidatus Cloacimonadales bacterium]
MRKLLPLFLILIFLASCSLNKGKSGGFIYIVKSGDNLNKISREYNISVSTLKYYNDKYYNDLIIGEKLFIPLPNHELVKQEAQVSAGQIVPRTYNSEKVSDGLIYRVQAGDTIYAISRNFGLTAAQLQELNDLDNSFLAINQKLYIQRFESKMAQKRNIETSEKKHQLADKADSTNKAAADSPNKGDINSFPVAWKDSFLLPVTGSISSPFGMRGGRLHKGVDITAPPGTAIKAAYDGTVSYTGFLRDYGNVLIIEHGNEIVTVYAHNEINLVKKSDKVNKGDVIARLGSTGRSTGPHLHFEIRVGNEPIDPAKIISEINSLKKI